VLSWYTSSDGDVAQEYIPSPGFPPEPIVSMKVILKDLWKDLGLEAADATFETVLELFGVKR
jgi:hypothetical protein